MSDKIDLNDKNLIKGHEYDGIQELDNPLPKWWIYLFYLTIIYGVSYWAYYEFLGGPSHKQQYEAAMTKIEKRAKSVTKIEEPVEVVDIKELLKDSKALALGKENFGQFCSACHGQKGEGVIGPNLTDEYWLHSDGGYDGIMTAIIKGFPEKGMPPWGDVVPKNRQPQLAAYVMSLLGSKPANPKDPQGEIVK